MRKRGVKYQLITAVQAGRHRDRRAHRRFADSATGRRAGPGRRNRRMYIGIGTVVLIVIIVLVVLMLRR
jgi:hypothetical protein